MKVLLTGVAGFIGSQVAEALVKRGDHVVGVDNLNDYYNVQQKLRNLEIVQEAALQGNFEFHRLDLCDVEVLDELFARHDFDCVVHLAAQAGVRYSIGNPVEVVTANVTATVGLLNLCGRHEVHHVVIASSSSVYGCDTEPPFNETARCDHPVSPYAATKKSCELFAYAFYQVYGFCATLLRFFTVYGPRGRPDMAVYKFVSRVLKGEEVEVYGDGSALREFTYISDIVNGVLTSIDTPCGFRTINLGGGSSHTVSELINLIEKHTGMPAIVRRCPSQLGDVPMTSACQHNALKLLRFKPEVTLDEGIARTVKWCREWLAYDESNWSTSSGISKGSENSGHKDSSD